MAWIEQINRNNTNWTWKLKPWSTTVLSLSLSLFLDNSIRFKKKKEKEPRKLQWSNFSISSHLDSNDLTGTIPTELQNAGLSNLKLQGNEFCPVLDYSTWANFADYSPPSGPCIGLEDKKSLTDFYTNLYSTGTLSWNLEDLCSESEIVCIEGKVTEL